MLRPLVTVIMPNYNGKRFVRQAIESVLNQTYSNWELIIIDDKSTDGSPELIEEYCKRDTRVTLIRSPQNNGVSIARNIGICRARGEFIALLDNDDWWEQDKLERQVELAGTGADIIYCSYDLVDEENQKIKRPYIVPEKINFDMMLTSNSIGCSTVFVRADLMREHPFRAEFYHEDYVLWMELLRLQAIAIGDPKVLTHYRLVSGSRSGKKINAAKERWKVYRKALHLNLFVSSWAFFGYALKGFSKYYL